MNSHLTAHFRVVTPMFLGGADPTSEAELRPASIKGALRFWWRALMWNRGINTVAALREREAALFGSSEKGQAKFLLSISMSSMPTKIPNGNVLNKTGAKAATANMQQNDIVGDGARYLGYGLMEAFGSSKKNTKAGQLIRPCLAAPFEFTVNIMSRCKTCDADIADAIKLLGLLGGLGSRSRRGYGNVTLTQLDVGGKIWNPPDTIDIFIHELRKIISPQNTNTNGLLPEWTAFAAGHSKVLLLQGTRMTSPLEVLSKMGRDFVLFRSWGHDGKVLGEFREENFRPDHDLMKMHPAYRKTHPQRIVFGLPHNYAPKDGSEKAKKEASVNGKEFERRASPLFFHVHQIAPTDIPLGVLTFIPSLFLPEKRDEISVGGTHVPLEQNSSNSFWKPAADFLTRILSADGEHPVPPSLKPSAVEFTHTQLVNIP
ncbi:MAG: type III-B CRISPR module RAMP protein Cmr1 [Opitutaceae bacterium]|jgi:CRISPR-associated protein Cmr1|nr:type III-B CRISPR module RAMP protein Cmr1 [Opitutaceae bacterium]